MTYTKNPKDAFIIWPQSKKNVKFIAMIRLASDKNYHPRLKIPLSVVSGQWAVGRVEKSKNARNLIG